MSLLLLGIGLVLVFEGVPWFASPAAMRRFVLQLASLPDASLRVAGLCSMLAGLGLVWLVRG
ncbi:MAG: DUF2065 domain-containing protein [Deltaproteobacteria bacterium]|nr:MAG: DUF2065 domain-containing protein [Deltaproteobacteria bacterium]